MQNGFNLIELMVIVALAGILLALGMPAMTEMIANGRVRNAAEGLVNGLQLARAEAIRRNALVNLVILSDGAQWYVVANGAAVQTRSGNSPGNVSSNLVGTRSITFLDREVGPPTPANISLVNTTVVTFNGWGSMTSPGALAIRFSSATSGTRAMCAVVTASTPRLCDPNRKTPTDGGTDPNAASDPQACYSAGTFIAGC